MPQNAETGMTEDDLFPTVAFQVADPRRFDGDPYEVAERACRQAAGIAAVLDKVLDATEKMARNAEMERAFANHEEPQGSNWPNTAQGRRFARLREEARGAHRMLLALATASGYNPRRPPKETR